MRESRRKALILLGCVVGAIAIEPIELAKANPEPASPRPGQDASQSSPNAPIIQPSPAETSKMTKAILEENQKNLKKDAEKLYKLASELKDQVEKTDSTTVLSLALVKKAEEIEKLAKQIKDRAKG